MHTSAGRLLAVSSFFRPFLGKTTTVRVSEFFAFGGSADFPSRFISSNISLPAFAYDPATWVSGVYGAVAEFSVGQGETIDLDLGESIVSATSPRGAVSFCLSEKIRVLAFGASPALTAAAGVVLLALTRA